MKTTREVSKEFGIEIKDLPNLVVVGVVLKARLERYEARRQRTHLLEMVLRSQPRVAGPNRASDP